MPQTEDEVKDANVSEYPSKITTWWNKFHFSGRVIMCSVLFGLGLVLIGGLIFAINMDDDTKKNEKSEIVDELPTKAPSNYVGPVVMGIGGFIVTVGVIMCLFETQVCRKKSGDAKPLIPDKAEISETKVSDSAAVPSSSHSHKSHKHKSRKVSSSPRKTKSKHAKTQSREQKQASSKSPPISIDKSKSFMTSSEDNFLTPPNEHPGHILEYSNSREVEIQTSSSLMQSFTSSGPSWNQSTEFLTPTASFIGNSISIDNSVELDEKQGQVNFKTNEVSEMGHMPTKFMTPLMSEEERIQKMFTQVENERMKTSKVLAEEKESEENLGFDHKNDTGIINSENMKTSENDLSLEVSFHSSAVEKAADKLALHNKTDDKVNDFSDEFSISSNVSPEKIVLNESEKESSDMTARKNEKENNNKSDIPSSHESTVIIKSEEGNDITEENENFCEKGTKELDPFITRDSSTSYLNEVKGIQKFVSEESIEKISKNDLDADLESNASSEETLISRDSSIEKPKDNNAQTKMLMAEENTSDKFKTSDASEFFNKDSLSNHGISDHRNSLTDNLKAEKVGASDLTDTENYLKETENIDEKLSEKSS